MRLLQMPSDKTYHISWCRRWLQIIQVHSVFTVLWYRCWMHDQLHLHCIHESIPQRIKLIFLQPFPKINGALMLRLYGLGHQPDGKLFLALHWEIAFHVSALVYACVLLSGLRRAHSQSENRSRQTARWRCAIQMHSEHWPYYFD